MRLDFRCHGAHVIDMPSVMRELRRRVRAEQSRPKFEPCLPRSADRPPGGPGWLHEIKHDGFRILAHRQGRSVRLITRNARDLADRFPLAAEAIEALPVRSCVIDGEAIVCDDNGLAVFDLIRGHGSNARAILCAFDLLELNGEDYDASRSRIASAGWLGCCGCRMTALHSTRLSTVRVQRSSSMPARSVARVSCRSGLARRTAPAGRHTGSRSRIRQRRPYGGSKKRIGTRPPRGCAPSSDTHLTCY
jgi:hypothetical protein